MKKEYNYSNDFQLATQLKSWMAINPSYGCIWDCAYCIQHKDIFFDMSEYKQVNHIKVNGQTIVPEDVVSEILINPRINSETPLALYNFSDPFLPQNTSGLISILEELDERELKNPVGLITRTFVGDKILDKIADLHNLKPIVLVSYAGYENKNIELAPNSKRRDLIIKLNEREIPVLQYMRPMVQEWVEDGQIERTRDKLGEYVDGVIMSGIRLTPEIISKIENKNLLVPFVPNHTNKFFPKELQDQIIEAYQGVAPVYRYTSCGVSATLGMPDYNAHFDFLKRTGKISSDECPLPCKDGQNKICHKQTILETEESKVKVLLSKIGMDDLDFKIESSGQVIFEKEIPKEDRTFLRHNLLRHIDYKDNIHHVDQIGFGRIGI